MPSAPSSPANRPEPRPGYIAVGYVRGPHGRTGELKVDPLSDYPKRFRQGATLWAGNRTYVVRAVRKHQRTLLLELEGIDARLAAFALRGVLLEVPEAELPPLGEGEYYRYQVIGIDVVDTAGRALGTLAEVLETGANDVYVVRGEDGELLIPAIDAVVKEVHIGERRMVVELLPGMEPRLSRVRG